jgi:hypothetical protein
MVVAPCSTPLTPNAPYSPVLGGTNGFQLEGSTLEHVAKMKRRMTRILMTTTMPARAEGKGHGPKLIDITPLGQIVSMAYC